MLTGTPPLSSASSSDLRTVALVPSEVETLFSGDLMGSNLRSLRFSYFVPFQFLNQRCFFDLGSFELVLDSFLWISKLSLVLLSLDEPPETLSSEIEGVNGEEDQLEVQTNIISSDSRTRMSCKEKVKSMNSDKLQVPSMVTPDSCAFGEASTEAGQTISKATSHVLAGPALPQPQLQGAWTKPLLITGATERSTMLSDNPVTENSEWPALSTRDIDIPISSQAKEAMPMATIQASNSQKCISHARVSDQPATPKDDIFCICDEVIEKINSTDVDDLVSLATISVLENLYESATVICVNETIESPPTESAPIKQHTESSVTQTSAEVSKESSRMQEIDLGSNQFTFLTSLEGEEQYQLELDESSGPIDLLTLSGKRLLRKKPVKPSAKGMEWQLQSTSHGRGNRGGENRGKVR
ncbi:hypothetical protein Bca52824_048431 [Brassica carinata]|uniref:Uncharacterized protein n=1 Tax=Brassica carinata TaxID=52824 RepID=A0A8X7US62_BRACI|nr:hypothetical protein Bca52824_048431 [Brassica carinata]